MAIAIAMHPHLEALAEDVFQVATRWPHYRLLLDDMQALHEEYRTAHVLSLERSIQGTCGKAGGPSRWAPLFDDLTVVDHGISDDRLDYSVSDEIMKEEEWDLVLNPNLLHHVRDQAGLFQTMAALMGPDTELYIFDTPFRELHDCPGDYVRYTPYGIRDALERVGITEIGIQEVCNPLEAIHYCLDFAKQSGALEELRGPIWQRYIRKLGRLVAPAEQVSWGYKPPPYARRMCMAWSVRGRRR